MWERPVTWLFLAAWCVEQWLRLGDWSRVALQVALLRAAVIGSHTYRAMSSSDRRLLSPFRPCWGNRLRPVEDDGAHNTCIVGANRWTLPQVHTVIASVHSQNAVGKGVPFEDGERCGSRADSYLDLS